MKHASRTDHSSTSTHYPHLAVMTVLSFVAMFALMYAMVDRLANVYVNGNQAYMAALMTAAMVLIELGIMRAMYQNKRLNIILVAVSLVVLAGSWLLIRQQTAISDRQFLRSMIPHHVGAILMCEQAPIEDISIKRLCEGIIRSQQAEIDLMKAKLGELSAR